MEKGIETHSSILAWKIPWTEDPGGRLQSMGLQRVRHNLVTKQPQQEHKQQELRIYKLDLARPVDSTLSVVASDRKHVH